MCHKSWLTVLWAGSTINKGGMCVTSVDWLCYELGQPLTRVACVSQVSIMLWAESSINTTGRCVTSVDYVELSQQTRELIRAQMTLHKHNNKDLSHIS